MKIGKIGKTAPVWLVILMIALSAASSMYAVAVTLTVDQKKIQLFGESVIVDTRFTVTSKGLGIVGLDKTAAAATEATAVEMANPHGTVNNALVKNHWTYQFLVDESSIASVAASTTKFSIEFFQDGVLLTTLYIVQVAADATKIEGVTVNVDLGTDIPASSMFVIRVAEVAGPAGVLRTFNMNGDAGIGWTATTAVPGNADGSAYTGTNPNIKMKAGETMVLVGTQVDGSPHNLALCPQSTATTTNRCTTGLLAGPSPTTAATGQTTTMTYAVPSTAVAGSTWYTYFCQFHASMTGTVTIVP